MSSYDTAQESLEHLSESVLHAIHILTGISDDISAGKYSQEDAERDYENLMWADGLDFMSAIEDYATWQPVDEE